MIVFRKVLVALVFAYLAGFLIALAHFPTTMKRGLMEVRPSVLLFPASVAGIVRAYGQFALAGTWPFDSQRDVVLLKDVIASKGAGSPSRRIRFDRSPQIGPGKEGRTVYDLGHEWYGKAFYGAFVDLQGGGLIRIGRYFCLMTNTGSFINNIVGPSDCYELILRSGGRYYWRTLGKKADQPVHMVD